MVEGWRTRVVGVGVGVAVIDCGWRWDAISASLLGAVFEGVGIDWERDLQRRGFEEGKINWHCTFWR